jgi:hypothetical protein
MSVALPTLRCDMRAPLVEKCPAGCTAAIGPRCAAPHSKILVLVAALARATLPRSRFSKRNPMIDSWYFCSRFSFCRDALPVRRQRKFLALVGSRQKDSAPAAHA